jgi:hypothetical protein
MARIIEVKGSVMDWASKNSDLIHREILEACERDLGKNTTVVEVVLLKTSMGITKFVLDGQPKILNSLQLAMDSFVEREDYETAARVRDCKKGWEEKFK